jgi:hypothetical protein
MFAIVISNAHPTSRESNRTGCLADLNRDEIKKTYTKDYKEGVAAVMQDAVVVRRQEQGILQKKTTL